MVGPPTRRFVIGRVRSRQPVSAGLLQRLASMIQVAPITRHITRDVLVMVVVPMVVVVMVRQRMAVMNVMVKHGRMLLRVAAAVAAVKVSVYARHVVVVMVVVMMMVR